MALKNVHPNALGETLRASDPDSEATMARTLCVIDPLALNKTAMPRAVTNVEYIKNLVQRWLDGILTEGHLALELAFQYQVGCIACEDWEALVLIFKVPYENRKPFSIIEGVPYPIGISAPLYYFAKEVGLAA